MKDSAKAIWMRRRDGIEEVEDDRLDLLPDEPTRALWNACPNPPPLDMAEANALFRRALEQSGVKPRWWFMPRPIALTFATCGGVFLAAFLAFGPSNGPSAWLPLIQSLAPSQNASMAVAQPAKPVQVAQSPPTGKADAAEVNAYKPALPDKPELARFAVAAPVKGTLPVAQPSEPVAAHSTLVPALPRTKPAPARFALAAMPAPSQRPYIYVTVMKPEPVITASITHDDSSRGGYARVTALRPNDNGVLVRTEATVTPSEPDPQVVTHVPSWATGMNGLPAPVSTRTNLTVPASDGGKE